MYVPSVYLFVYISVLELVSLSGNYVYYSHSMNSINQIKPFALKKNVLKEGYTQIEALVFMNNIFLSFIFHSQIIFKK